MAPMKKKCFGFIGKLAREHPQSRSLTIAKDSIREPEPKKMNRT
jgi:hypothetical protein